MSERISTARRGFLKTLGKAALALPFYELLRAPRPAHAGNVAKRVIFFYFPDGGGSPSGNSEPNLNWSPVGSTNSFTLSKQLEPLAPYQNDCVFLQGLSLGPTGAGSHPEGAKKLLTGVDGGMGQSLDQFLAQTVGAQSPFHHLYLGAMSKVNKNTPRSADCYITYASPGQSLVPEDDPRVAFQALFGGSGGGSGGPGGEAQGPDPMKVSVIDGVLADMNSLKAQLGSVEGAKLDLHLEALREVEQRIKKVGSAPPSASCEEPTTAPLADGDIYTDAMFPEVLRAQIDLMVLAMACGLTKVGTLQSSYHTSELIMSRFPDTEMFLQNFDMRSHQASHYGNPGDQLFTHYVNQRRFWVSQFAYLLKQLASRPDGDGTMLDTSLVVLCSEVGDGNTHVHDNMPFVLAGRAGGALSTGRLLQYNGTRHSNLLSSIAHAMGQPVCFGQECSGPLPSLLS